MLRLKPAIHRYELGELLPESDWWSADATEFPGGDDPAVEDLRTFQLVGRRFIAPATTADGPRVYIHRPEGCVPPGAAVAAEAIVDRAWWRQSSGGDDDSGIVLRWVVAPEEDVALMSDGVIADLTCGRAEDLDLGYGSHLLVTTNGSRLLVRERLNDAYTNLASVSYPRSIRVIAIRAAHVGSDVLVWVNVDGELRFDAPPVIRTRSRVVGASRMGLYSGRDGRFVDAAFEYGAGIAPAPTVRAVSPPGVALTPARLAIEVDESRPPREMEIQVAHWDDTKLPERSQRKSRVYLRDARVSLRPGHAYRASAFITTVDGDRVTRQERKPFTIDGDPEDMTLYDRDGKVIGHPDDDIPDDERSQLVVLGWPMGLEPRYRLSTTQRSSGTAPVYFDTTARPIDRRSRAPRQWTAAFNAITWAERDELLRFVSDARGRKHPFVWIRPLNDERVAVRLSEPRIDSVPNENLFNIDVNLSEDFTQVATDQGADTYTPPEVEECPCPIEQCDELPFDDDPFGPGEIGCAVLLWIDYSTNRTLDDVLRSLACCDEIVNAMRIPGTDQIRGMVALYRSRDTNNSTTNLSGAPTPWIAWTDDWTDLSNAIAAEIASTAARDSAEEIRWWWEKMSDEAANIIDVTHRHLVLFTDGDQEVAVGPPDPLDGLYTKFASRAQTPHIVATPWESSADEDYWTEIVTDPGGRGGWSVLGGRVREVESQGVAALAVEVIDTCPLPSPPPPVCAYIFLADMTIGIDNETYPIWDVGGASAGTPTAAKRELLFDAIQMFVDSRRIGATDFVRGLFEIYLVEGSSGRSVIAATSVYSDISAAIAVERADHHTITDNNFGAAVWTQMLALADGLHVSQGGAFEHVHLIRCTDGAMIGNTPYLLGQGLTTSEKSSIASTMAVRGNTPNQLLVDCAIATHPNNGSVPILANAQALIAGSSPDWGSLGGSVVHARTDLDNPEVVLGIATDCEPESPS